MSKTEMDFWELYWGEMAMVEDKKVESAMVLFGKSLIAANDTECAASKASIALTLDHCARDSLAAGWGLQQLEANEYCTAERFKDLKRLCP